ncbi:RNA polymerase sigma-70 factor, ECF subfamily [Pseudomonas asplenii]|uniref:RNA polymerase sigma-70 factor, ECF subfamily n=2 Tax=Pseudomonas asplenii TaxID=53407 RepID=A0A1H6NYQ0_9PSED|nr:RNA polymerase sigma-70 factor, ECF subfamily [Pseudomonas fuscovaginae]
MAATDSRIRSDLLTMVFRSDYSWLTARLRYKLGCRYNAEDVASEAFTQLAAMPTLQEVKEPRAMLTTIANRVMYELSRRRDLERAYMEALALAPEACHPSPEEQHLLMESLLAVDKALEGLSVNARSAFLYSQLDGLTYAQIGELLGVSAARVRQYMVKALRCCYEAALHEQGI